jgi:hypothetical protein
VPITYAIDPDKRLVVSHIWGPATESEVHEHNQKLRHDPLFDPTYQQLADMSGVTELLVPTSTVRDTALDSFFAPGVRRAFVACADGVFGMARMFALHAESQGQVVEVFRDRHAAEEWLGIK